jgi:predicted MFS family arabinose efflux permease
VSSRLGALRERPFRLLFLGRTASLLGSAFAPVALAFAVLDNLDGSATDLGIVLAAIWVPQVFFILVGGVWADRVPRNLVMVATDLVMFAAQGTVALLLLTGNAELWQLIVLQVVRGVANAFFFPASTGLIPSVVSPGRLQQANALLRLASSTTSIVGAGLAGLVVGGVGAGWALAFDAVTFLVSAAFVVQVRVPAGARHAASSFVHELREGWAEFASRTWLWSIVVAFMFINAFENGTYLVLGPVVAKDSLGGASGWGAILAGFAAGSVLGGLIVLRWRPRRLLLAGCLAIPVMAPACFLLAIPAALIAIVAAFFVAGISVEVFQVMWDTALQQQIPHDRLSRVSSYDALGSFICIPIGMSVAGPLSELLGVTGALVFAGCVNLVASACVLTVHDVRTLRRTDSRRPPGDEPAAPEEAVAHQH